MAEPNSAGRTPQEPPPLYHEAGLLEEFNLPPKVIRYLRAHQRQLWTIAVDRKSVGRERV